MPASKIITGLSPGTPLTEAVKILISTEIDKMVSLSGDKRGIQDADIIHDIRVSARRFQTILESIGEILPTKLLFKGKAKAKEIIKALGKARENDVSIGIIEKYMKSDKKSASAILGLLTARLKKATEEHRGEAYSNSYILDNIFYLNNEYLEQVNNLNLKLFRDVKYLDKNASLEANGLLILPRLYDRVLRLGKISFAHQDKDTSGKSAEDLHKMRIKAKPLRYTMEFFRFAYGEDFAGYVKEVKKFVELLGGIHDRDVVLEQLSGFLEEIKIFNKNAGKGKIRTKPIEKTINQLKDEREGMFIKVKKTFEGWINGDFRQKMILSLANNLALTFLFTFSIIPYILP